MPTLISPTKLVHTSNGDDWCWNAGLCIGLVVVVDKADGVLQLMQWVMVS